MATKSHVAIWWLLTMQLLTQVPRPGPQLSRSEKCAGSLRVSQPDPIKYDYHKIPTYGSLLLSRPWPVRHLFPLTVSHPFTRWPGARAWHALQSPLCRLITDKHAQMAPFWQMSAQTHWADVSVFPDPGMSWAGCWPRDSDQQLPHLAVIKDAETRVWDEECKVRSLITRGDIAGITLHLTLVMTNSLRVNQAQSPEFLVILGFCNQRAEGSVWLGALGRWSTVGIKMIKQDSSICMKFNLSDTPGNYCHIGFSPKIESSSQKKYQDFLISGSHGPKVTQNSRFKIHLFSIWDLYCGTSY